METAITHRCSRCETEKDVSSFYSSQLRSGGAGWCRACYRDWYVERTGGTVERPCDECGNVLTVTVRRAAEKRVFCSRECKSSHRVVSNYGLTRADYNEMLEEQGGGCAICGTDSADALLRRLVVDHNHETGEVRGLLCSACNAGIGHFRDNPHLLDRAIRYLSEEVSKVNG